MALIDLGYCVAKLTVLDDSGYHRLQIMVPAQREHGTDIPDNSIEIYGKDELIALRDALNAAYPADATTVE